MSDFCKQCSEAAFGEDYGDLRGLGNGRTLPFDAGWLALCEGCGPTAVDDNGACVSINCLQEHGK